MRRCKTRTRFSSGKTDHQEYGAKIYSFSVYKMDYDDLMPDDLREYGGDHYTWAIRHLPGHLAAWRVSRHVKFPIEYLFDGMEKSDSARNKIETVKP